MEPKKIRNFNNVPDAGGSQKPCKERLGSIIGQTGEFSTFSRSALESPNESHHYSAGTCNQSGSSMCVRSRLNCERGVVPRAMWRREKVLVNPSNSGPRR